jgi:iron(III) transport system ATP-binding protein
MCVSLKHGLVVVSDTPPGAPSIGGQLHVHSLADGSLVRSIGSKGSGKAQFSFSCGGLCVSPDGDSVLVAESHNNRVQEVRIDDGSWVRFVGVDVLKGPEFVDCNSHAIAVSEWCDRISLFARVDGRLMAQCGNSGSGPGQLNYPRGLRLLNDGSGVVVADKENRRLCVFSVTGEFVRAIGNKELGLHRPRDVIIDTSDGSFIIANFGNHNLLKVSSEGEVVGAFGERGDGDGEVTEPSALAVLPGGGLLVRECEGRRFQVFHPTAPGAFSR